MSKVYKCLIYKPYEKGEVKEITFDKIREEIGGYLEAGYTSPQLEGDNYLVYVHDEGMLINLPYCRGVHGTFAVLGRLECEEISLTDEDIKYVRSVLDKYTKKFNFPLAKENNLLQELEDFFNENEFENEVYNFSEGGIFLNMTTNQIIDFIGSTKDEQAIENIYKTITYCNVMGEEVSKYLEFVGKELAKSRMKTLAEQYKGFL